VDTSLRVLIVDDFPAWRRFVASAIHKQPDLLVIGEASDGLEAIQKAERLKPDLILLDIGLPTLNGIEAAARIHQLLPNTKILFTSQVDDLQVVRAALRNGAQGYVLKTNAGSELSVALQAVIRGGRFVSSRLEPQITEYFPGLLAASPAK
jgi:DNA-binding NarL/FixJ family response regulator